MIPALALALLACGPKPPPPPEIPFPDRVIDAAGMERAFPSDRVKDRAGWAQDLDTTLRDHAIKATNANVCAVVATIEQESGYAPDPVVPGIGTMIDRWIAEKQASMNPVAGWALGGGLQKVLDVTPPGQKASFYQRLHAARTERDIDVTYRDFVAYYRSKLPSALQKAESAAEALGFDLDAANPITTAGCMQVRVDLAEAHAHEDGTDPRDVRDALYTRAGCVHYGTVRLLGWEVGYDRPLYRFADYNAGFYASRNAAFQEQVSRITGLPLALDGDLLRYGPDGRPLREPSSTQKAVVAAARDAGLDERTVARDLYREKTAAFEDTETWKQVRALYEKKTGEKPAYARLPDVHLQSLKLSGDRTTAWYATSVDRRYDACMDRLRGDTPAVTPSKKRR